MKARQLGTLEQKVMDMVWERKRCTVREVFLALKRHRKIAYTTVATEIQRLCDKDLLVKEKNGASYIYLPKVSQKNFTKMVAQAFIKKFVASFGEMALASFVESIDNLPKENRDYFIRLLKRAK